jgi:hypothetical protein
MRTFSKSITLAIALTLTLASTPSFAVTRDREQTREHRGVIERIIAAVRNLIISIDDVMEVPKP